MSSEPLPHLDVPAHTTRSFRVEGPDGRVLKHVVVDGERRAATIERAITVLSLDALPRIVRRDGNQLDLEWLDGDDEVEPSAADAGAFLARVHAGSPAGLVTEPRLTNDGAWQRLDTRLATLDTATATVLRSWANTYRQEADARAVFVHTDLCPENIVYVNGQMRVIDNGSWAIGPAVYDVARLWWRWPMEPAARRSFRDAYGPIDESLPFWIVVAAVGSTLYRAGGRRDIADAAHARLTALPDLARHTSVELFDAAIP